MQNKTHELLACQAQEDAILSYDPLITVVAGPGSGKTSTSVRRICRLIKEGCSPSEIVAITFTNAAANELLERIAGHLGEAVKLGYVGTLHGFMLQIVQANAKTLGFTSGVTVVAEEHAARILGEVMREHRWKGSAETVKTELLFGPFRQGRTPLELLRLAYYARMRKAGMIDFDAILHYGLHAIKSRLNCPTITHLFVDEFQDSSELDAEIYRWLPARNRFFVGDIDQSIYAFRGGRPAIMLRMLQSGEGFKVCLQQNFRSDKLICAAANALIRYNRERFDKATMPHSRNPGQVQVKTFDNPAVEMAWIGAEIQRLNQFSQTAVLVRTNALKIELANYLEAVGIKVNRKTKRQWPAGWQKCRAFMEVLTNPDNDELAYNYLLLTIGERQAKTIQLQAFNLMKSVNEIALKIDGKITSAKAVPDYLRLQMIDPASVSIVTEALKKTGEQATLNDLLMFIASDEGKEESETEGVTVATVHAAKGLEWDNVFLPAFEQGVMPTLRKDSDIEEERRLAFVAMTRARHTLNISHCHKRKKPFGNDDSAFASQFINEIQVA